MSTAARERPVAKGNKRQAKTEKRTDTINLRVPPKVRRLIDKAAETLGKTRTDFVLDSAKKHAIDVLLDQRYFELDEARWATFEAALKNPPMPNDRLKKLMAAEAPWEKS